MLGSSLFSAQLAAKLGLPYSFASHFAPRMLGQAIELYRENFEPSEYLDKPYVSMGVPVVVANTDEEAQFLATSAYQRVLGLIQGKASNLSHQLYLCRDYGTRQNNFLLKTSIRWHKSVQLKQYVRVCKTSGHL